MCDHKEDYGLTVRDVIRDIKHKTEKKWKCVIKNVHKLQLLQEVKDGKEQTKQKNNKKKKKITSLTIPSTKTQDESAHVTDIKKENKNRHTIAVTCSFMLLKGQFCSSFESPVIHTRSRAEAGNSSVNPNIHRQAAVKAACKHKDSERNTVCRSFTHTSDRPLSPKHTPCSNSCLTLTHSHTL